MRKKILVCFGFLIFFSSFVFVKEVGSWNDKVTHKDLSKFAAENSVLDISKGNYMKNLGFSAGLSEKFIWNSKAQSGLLWLQEGAELEDDSSPGFPIIPGSTTRSFNHFHNPLKPWSQAGLDDTWTGESSLLWAQDGIDQQNFPSGDWSWQRIRDYYHLALTSTTDAERQANFARTFRGLGHQMHLIQDAAQPDHVRNDAHPEDAIGLSYGIGFEKWAAMNRSFINYLALTPLLPQVSLNVAYNNLAPITQFIDAEQYDGTNPSTALSQGIAEYTTANFFSDDTIFAAESYSTDHRHYFPYPKKSSTDIQEYINQNKLPETVIAEDGVEDLGFWISKKTDGEIVEHFVKPSYFTRPVVDLLGDNQKLYHLLFYRDEKCHEDYAKKLIPKAVGYSAGLLNYFFRGEIDMVPDYEAGYGYRIVNKTDEEMNGRFELYYDNDKGERKMIQSWTFAIGRKGSGNNKSQTITFSSPTDARELGKYMLVFRGRLGNEEDAVVGRYLKVSWPRGGIIKRVWRIDTMVVVYILYEDNVKTYYISVPPNERIIKAAFDEGNVESIRVLTRTWSEWVRIYKLHNFRYDRRSDKFIKIDEEELMRVNDYNTEVKKTEFSYATKEISSTYYYSEENKLYKGLVIEYLHNFPPVDYDWYTSRSEDNIEDFFVTKDRNIKLLKGVTRNITLGMFITNLKTDYIHKEGECIWGYHMFEEIIGEPNFSPEPLNECRKYGETYRSKCGNDFTNTFDMTGMCYKLSDELGYQPWNTCSGGDLPYSTFDPTLEVWLDASLEYEGILKKVSNPQVFDTSRVWSSDSTGRPCALFNSSALRVNGGLIGRILSESQIVTKYSMINYSYPYSTYNENILIEPDGITLDKMPVLILRQSGGYSMIEEIQKGKVISRTSFIEIPAELPILLNGEGNGFKITFETTPWGELMKFQVGFGYDRITNDFIKTGLTGIYGSPQEIMDLMVEYIREIIWY